MQKLKTNKNHTSHLAPHTSDSRGITLVALVITIIVMLILVGVTITVAINGGLIDKTKEAADKTKLETDRETLTAAVIAAMNNQGIVEKSSDIAYHLPEDWEVGGEDLGPYTAKSPNLNVFTVDKYGKISDNESEEPDNPGEEPDNPPDPEEPQKPTEGEEITQEEIGDFVFIPVPTVTAENETDLENKIAQGKYPMAVKTTGTDEKGRQNYRGVLYDFSLDETTNTVKITPIANSADGYREPAFLEGEDDSEDALKYVTLTQKSLQEDFNEMVEHVINLGGFYIGAYEAAFDLEANTVWSKKGSPPVGLGNWYAMYSIIEKQSPIQDSKNNELKAHMIWGSQWDQVMIWLKDEKNTTDSSKYFIIDSSGMTSNMPAMTGANENDVVKGIYDLAGNMSERTMEAYKKYSRVMRGGDTSIGREFPPSERRDGDSPSAIIGVAGTRLVLY